MRLLLLTQYFPPEIGAAQTRLDALTRAVHRAGHDVDVVTAMPSYPSDAILVGYRHKWFMRQVEPERSVIRTWAYPAMGSGLKRMVSYGIFSVTSLGGLVRSKRPDVLLIESPPLPLAVPGLLWARLRRVPVVFNVADLWPDAPAAVGALHDGFVLRAMYSLERWAYRRSSLVSTVTEGVADQLLNVKRIPSDKLIMLPNGVDTERFCPAESTGAGRRLLVDLPAQPFLVYAGTMGMVHGIEPLIDAFRQLHNEEVDSPTLLMLGAGSERALLERRANQAHLTNVVFHDPIPPEQLAMVLNDAVAGIVTLADIPINQHARPAKMFPIMAAGRPVLFAGAGEGARLLAGAGGGLVVNNDSGAIAAAVRQLVDDADSARAMGVAGRDYVVKNLSWPALIGDWLDRVQRLVVGI